MDSKDIRIFNCRVCGFHLLEPPWGKDGTTPNYEICPCCGCEFGLNDYTLEVTRRYREKWIKDGSTWFLKKERPTNWDMEKQLLNIPPNFL
jgi:hypothetical protein